MPPPSAHRVSGDGTREGEGNRRTWNPGVGGGWGVGAEMHPKTDTRKGRKEKLAHRCPKLPQHDTKIIKQISPEGHPKGVQNKYKKNTKIDSLQTSKTQFSHRRDCKNQEIRCLRRCAQNCSQMASKMTPKWSMESRRSQKSTWKPSLWFYDF